MKQFINIRIMILSTAAILLTAVFCTLAYYNVFRQEVMDNLKILLKEDKVNDVKFYMPEEKTCLRLADFFSIFSDTTRIKILSAGI